MADMTDRLELSCIWPPTMISLRIWYACLSGEWLAIVRFCPTGGLSQSSGESAYLLVAKDYIQLANVLKVGIEALDEAVDYLQRGQLVVVPVAEGGKVQGRVPVRFAGMRFGELRSHRSKQYLRYMTLRPLISTMLHMDDLRPITVVIISFCHFVRSLDV